MCGARLARSSADAFGLAHNKPSVTRLKASGLKPYIRSPNRHSAGPGGGAIAPPRAGGRRGSTEAVERVSERERGVSGSRPSALGDGKGKTL